MPFVSMSPVSRTSARRPFLRAALAAYPPDIIVNATAFATATANDDAGVLSASGCPVLQVAQAGISRASWESSTRGLLPRDLAMHVVLPEVDGRIFAHAIAFKERGDPRRALRRPFSARSRIASLRPPIWRGPGCGCGARQALGGVSR